MVHFASPEREVVLGVLRCLTGGGSREEASAWAGRWVTEDLPKVPDDAVWDALTRLCAADLIVPSGGYLYSVEDFEAWLQEFQSSDSAAPRADGAD